MSEWFPQSGKYAPVLGDCKSRAKVIPAQALQYGQHTLISDFLDLANLSMQEEAALATDWIKDLPEVLKLQNPTLAIRTGRSTGSLPQNLSADVHHAIDKCESLGPTIDPSRESIGTCKDFFHRTPNPPFLGTHIA